MANERLYVVAYDIAEPKRWRRVFKVMKGYGHWLQLSVFQCRLTASRLEGLIKLAEDHILIVDLGPADQVDPLVESLGKTYEVPSRQATIV